MSTSSDTEGKFIKGMYFPYEKHRGSYMSVTLN